MLEVTVKEAGVNGSADDTCTNEKFVCLRPHNNSSLQTKRLIKELSSFKQCGIIWKFCISEGTVVIHLYLEALRLRVPNSASICLNLYIAETIAAFRMCQEGH